jgi:hypothetical protein
MPRTTPDAVKKILGDNYTPGVDLDPFIETADALVDAVVECADPALTDAKLELLSRWLAAHAYAQMDQTKSSESTADASGSFHGQTGFFLRGTKYGQMALTLDNSGCLAAVTDPDVNVRQTASGFWAGTRRSDRRTYDERN